MNWIPLVLVAAVLVGVFLLKSLSFVGADKARALLQDGALIVDVRSPDEFAGRHLSGAINVPLSELRSLLPRQVPDKSQVLLLHCLSGGRSEIARRQLKRMGYAKVFNLGSYSRAQFIATSLRRE